MKINRSVRFGIGIMAIAFAATACGGGEESKSISENAADGKLTVGIKFDQPGLGLRNSDGTYTGFDVEVAKYVANELGVKPENITFKESPSAQRETLIQNGEVDYIVATYSITGRSQGEGRIRRTVFRRRPVAARQRGTIPTSPAPESLNGGKILCSVAGSTPAQKVKDTYAKDVQLQEFDTLLGVRRGATQWQG